MAGLKSSQYTDQGASRFDDADYIGEMLVTSESGNAQHHKQTVLNWNATQYKTNQTLSGSPATWDTANRYFPFATLTVTASQNVNLSNVRDTASGTLLITKNTASDVVITFGGSGLTHSPASVTLVNSTINTIFVIKWEADGTAIKWSLGFETIDSKFSNGVGNLTSDATLIGLGGNPLVEDTTIQGGTGSPLTPSYEFNFDNLTSLNLDAAEHSSALFRIESTTKGSKFAGTMDTTQRDAIATPLEGVSVYNSDNNRYEYYNGSAWAGIGVDTVGGADTQVLYNNSGAETGDANLTWDYTNQLLTVNGDSTVSGTMFEALNSGGVGWKFHNTEGVLEVGGASQNVIIGGDYSAYAGTGSTILGRGVSGVSTLGNNNVVIGREALLGSPTFASTVVIGNRAGRGITTNDSSIVIGSSAGSTFVATGNLVIGNGANAGGAQSMALGNSTTADNNYSVAFGQGVTAPERTVKFNPEYRTLMGGGTVAGVPFTVRALSATAGNDNGANLNLRGGAGFGTGNDGTVNILNASSTVIQVDDTGLGFFAATPIAQPSSTGETTGFTAGAGTGVNDDSTFTGNVGATAYRISDIVKHLKNLGLIAQ